MNQGESSMLRKEDLLKESSEAVAILLKQYEHYSLLLTILERGVDPRRTKSSHSQNYSPADIVVVGYLLKKNGSNSKMEHMRNIYTTHAVDQEIEIVKTNTYEKKI